MGIEREIVVSGYRTFIKVILRSEATMLQGCAAPKIVVANRLV